MEEYKIMTPNSYGLPIFDGMMDVKKVGRRSIPKSIKNEVLVKQNYKCHKCKKKLPATKHFHHKKPVSKGGKNTLSNIIAVCPNCHSDIHHKEKLKKANAKEKKRTARKKSNNPFDIDFKPPSFKF